MGTGTLTKYGASAGSGKTFELTTRYLLKLFNSPGQAYKKILAVTFTNKAAAEMKTKILNQLFSISKGENSKMTLRLMKETALPFEKLESKSQQILYSILQDYSFFHVGTIDSFFQRILRVFTREIGLQHGYLIEIEHKHILDQAVDNTLEDAVSDRALLNWLTRYEYDRIEEGKSWNIKGDISKLAEEIFSERFRLMSDVEREKLGDRNFLENYVTLLKNIQKDFASELTERAWKCRALLNKHNVTDNMFYGGSRRGVGSFIEKLAGGTDGIYKPPGSDVLKVKEPEPIWTSKAGASPELKAAFNDGFREHFLETLDYYEKHYPAANTARLIVENVYILGILSDILRNVHNVTTAENRFLLSDAGELLHRLICGDQTPFIYEKAGNTFENFMIDEFQDTSVIQWNNFLPLIENSMANGNDNLVVGDIKQSIYRWRNSDWRILGQYLEKQIDKTRIISQNLDVNYRSRKNIIAFNNALFSVLPELIDESAGNQERGMNLSTIYHDVRQICPENREGGFVRITFVPEEEDTFENVVLQKIPLIIEELQDKGYRASDIGILVRYNNEGAEVINSIIEYRASAGAEKTSRYNYSIVSGESLLLNSSPAIGFVIALFRFLLDPDDKLSKALMVRNWLIATGRPPVEKDLSDLNHNADELWPGGWQKFISGIKQKPVFEAIESVIRFFGIGADNHNTAFLNAFQDSVFEYSINYSSDIRSFLEWWDIYGPDRSLALSDQQDSIRVMTIHKAKGLEFRAVILPFVNWPLGHGKQNPTIWVTPQVKPFNNVNLVPVKYKSDLKYSLFADDYLAETYYAKIDNLNLLYVAFTRAKEVLFGFCPSKPENDSVAAWLSRALRTKPFPVDKKPLLNLPDYFNEHEGIFSTGEIIPTGTTEETSAAKDIRCEGYYVNDGIKGLHIKFHGEKWFIKQDENRKSKLNYGRLMHDVLASVITAGDIYSAVGKMILDGRINENEKDEIEKRILKAIAVPEVDEWFKPGLKILTEADILTTEGTLRRPDRVIISEDKVTVVDFKFGNERNEYIEQINLYKRLLLEMDYRQVDAFIWYVDGNKIVRVK
ncbi:MAG: UvrD-helicase domain-containing protein [Bacteroidales bacterium]